MNRALPSEFRIFIVEDESWYRQLLHTKLSMNPDFRVHLFENAHDVLDELHHKPHLIFLDIQLPDISGDRLLQLIRRKDQETKIAITSGQSDIRLAIDLLKNGADEYIVKDKDSLNKVWSFATKIFEERNLFNRDRQLHPNRVASATAEIIGRSEEIGKIRTLIDKSSRTSITVSIQGETGTGKELVAKSVHLASLRAEKPFVAVNVAAIPKDLIESELFGHEKGAFTGAHNRRIGKFEEANGGTLFLDEITELDISLQSKLLRVLQEKEVVRIGSNNATPLDVRIIIATNKSLMSEVKKNNFREDLYYRFLGLNIELPPLRSRTIDIPLLADHFISAFCKKNDLPMKSITDEGMERLMSYHFPGNVRELRAVVELGAALSGDELWIDAENLILEPSSEEFEAPREEMTLEEYNRKLILHYLKRYNNKVLVVAENLGIGKSTIYNLLKNVKHSESFDRFS